MQRIIDANDMKVDFNNLHTGPTDDDYDDDGDVGGDGDGDGEADALVTKPASLQI